MLEGLVKKGTVSTKTTYVIKDVTFTFTDEDLEDTTQIVLTKKELFELLQEKKETVKTDENGIELS